MRLPIVFRLIMATVLIAGFTSCEKEAGEGGTSIITGKIFVTDFNNSGVLQGSYYGAEEDVYITYGTNAVHDDDTRTGPDGSFKFQYLQPGTYTIFAYTDCSTCDSGTDIVSVEVEITDKNKTLTLDDITVIR